MSTILRAFEREHSAISPSELRAGERLHDVAPLRPRAGRSVSGEAALARHRGAQPCWSGACGTSARPSRSRRCSSRASGSASTPGCAAAVQVALDWIRTNLAGRQLILEHQVRLPWGRISGWLDVATADEPFVARRFQVRLRAWSSADTPQLGLYLIALLLEQRRSIEGEGEATAVVIQPRAPADPVRSARMDVRGAARPARPADRHPRQDPAQRSHATPKDRTAAGARPPRPARTSPRSRATSWRRSSPRPSWSPPASSAPRASTGRCAWRPRSSTGSGRSMRSPRSTCSPAARCPASS